MGLYPEAINPHIDWPDEQTVGIHVNLSHVAASPPGLTVTVKGKLEQVEGRKISFSVVADDGVDKISEGTHDRFVINAEKFNDKMAAKAHSKIDAQNQSKPSSPDSATRPPF